MYINFQQNQVKTQVMTCLLDIKLPRKEIIDADGRHDGQTNVHGRTDKRTRTDGRSDIASDNIRYFFRREKNAKTLY